MPGEPCVKPDVEHRTRAPRGLGTRAIRIAAWLLKAKCTHGALVIVRNSDDEYLLVRQRLRERNRWGFPGGFLNPAEAPADGAVRELREESGLELATHDLGLVAQYHQPWLRFFGHFDHVFVASVDKQDLPSRLSVEIRACDWFAAEDLPELTAATQEALRRLQINGAAAAASVHDREPRKLASEGSAS
jgi:8-oxo-dGTP diphosphatase